MERFFQWILSIPTINLLANIIDRDFLNSSSSVFRAVHRNLEQPSRERSSTQRVPSHTRNSLPQNSIVRTPSRMRRTDVRNVTDHMDSDEINEDSIVRVNEGDLHNEDFQQALAMHLSQYQFVIEERERLKKHQEEMRKISQIQQKEEREKLKQIMEEQDREYEESLMKDRKKEEERQAAELQQKQEEMQEEEKTLQDAIEFSKQLMSQKWKSEKLRSIQLPKEPKVGDNVIHLVARLPTGEKFERNFLLSDTLQDVQNFIDKQALEYGVAVVPDQYRLVTDFPRQIWDDLDRKLEDLPFRKRFLVRVEPFD